MERSSDVKTLPESLQDFIKKYPTIWNSYSKLGEECTKSGPLDNKQVELIKVAIYGLKGMHTPFKTHVRLALKFGATPNEIEHAILQMLTAEGISNTVMALKWANEVIIDQTD
jgi:alkylhydroperoxidase/carboxymuconolactone decarboxylase family protein YurZ